MAAVLYKTTLGYRLEQVFFRVLQLPLCSEAELRGMVELQLDKISPLPLAAVWTLNACRCIVRIGRSKRW